MAKIVFLAVFLLSSFVCGGAKVGSCHAPGTCQMRVALSDRTKMRHSSDLEFSADMRSAVGVAFDFRCADSAGISEFGFYLKSGDEWYYLDDGFIPGKDGEWRHVVLRKESFRRGVGASGWGRVDGARFSFWSNGTNDTTCEVANLTVVPSDHPSVVILGSEFMPDACAVRSADAMGRTLSALNVPFTMVADVDLTMAALDGVDVVALPYNPEIPQSALDVMRGFVAEGGRIFSVSYVPEEVYSLMGVEKLGGGYWSGWNGNPPLAGYRRTKDGLDGQPQFVASMSWGANGIASQGGVIAEWEDVNGRRIGVPAIVRGLHGFMVGHLWLGGEEAGSVALFGSIMSEMVPRLRERIDSAVAVAQQGQKPHPVVRPDLCRGIWCMSPYGYGGMDWERTAQWLKAHRVDFVVPCLADAASASYRSAVLEPRKTIATQGDALDACLAACRKTGIKCHVWKKCWTFDAGENESFVKRMREEGRLQMSSSGTWRENWLCPSSPANRSREIDAMAELASKGVDGVQLDFIRYGDGDCCFCLRCRELFERRVGCRMTSWPQAVHRSAELEQSWREFRCEMISSLVRELSEKVRQTSSRTKISAAVFADSYTAPFLVGQDWIPWCQNGWIDFACPMAYSENMARFKRTLEALRRRTTAVLMPGIGISVWKPDGPAVIASRLIKQEETVAEMKFSGCVLFGLDSIADRALSCIQDSQTSKKP